MNIEKLNNIIKKIIRNNEEIKNILVKNLPETIRPLNDFRDNSEKPMLKFIDELKNIRKTVDEMENPISLDKNTAIDTINSLTELLGAMMHIFESINELDESFNSLKDSILSIYSNLDMELEEAYNGLKDEHKAYYNSVGVI